MNADSTKYDDNGWYDATTADDLNINLNDWNKTIVNEIKTDTLLPNSSLPNTNINWNWPLWHEETKETKKGNSWLPISLFISFCLGAVLGRILRKK